MILDLIMGILVSVFTGLLGLLPAYSLPPEFSQVGASLGNALASAQVYFPVKTLGLCIAAVVGVRIFVAGLGVVVWVYDKIPLKFT